MRVVALIAGLACLLSAGVAFAQPQGGGGIALPPQGQDNSTGTLSIDDATVESGDLFSMTLHVETEEPTMLAMAFIDSVPSNVQFLEVVPGPALDSYIAAAGIPLSCDIVLFPSDLSILMFFGAPFDSSVHGTDLFTITCVANADEDGDYNVNYDWSVGSSSGSSTAVVTVGPQEEKFVRGDVNGDYSCSIVDAVKLLEILFQGDVSDCTDAGDLDDNGSVDIADAVSLLNSLFNGGPVIDEVCRVDGNADTLADCTRPSCD